MPVETLDDSNFEAALAGCDLAVVDFYAGWCGPCRLFAPKFRRIAEERTDLRFFKLDGEKAPASRKTVTIDSLPYFAIYRAGAFVAGLSTSSEETFRAFVDEHAGKATDAEGTP